MDEMESLSHTKWECKYHVVFIPKCRRKTLYGEFRQQKESRIEEGPLRPDRVHMMIAIPPKYGVSQVIGLSRGRVRFTWRECMGRGRGISWASISGRGGTTCPRWDGMRL
jgi:REP element-mobilizing transposase RayT